MASERVSNTFEGGMESDLDGRLSQANSYKLSVNGRIIYNKDGTLAWENEKGTIEAVDNFVAESQVIGVCEFPEFVIIFSKQYDQVKSEFYDEIGYIFFDEYGRGTYTKLYNDYDDVLGLKMSFDPLYTIQAEPFYESDEFVRVYWTDDKNEPRVFTSRRTSPTSLENITNTEFTMNLTPDFKMGELRFHGLVSGSLRSGIYQYSYRLKTNDGYQTPWTPITFPVIVTGRKPPEATKSQETYGMADVDVIGQTGTRLFIYNVDTRYQDIEVAYTHAITENGVKEGGIFVQKPIEGSSMTIEHTSIENIVPIDIAELTDLKDVILKAKTIQIHDNRLWLGNTENKKTFDIPEAVLANAWCEPEFRAIPIDLRASNWAGTETAGGFRPVYLFAGGATGVKRRYIDDNNDYSIATFPNSPNGGIKDYYNYMGAQMNHSWKGYFRSETYRFAVVFYDKKGFPFFAKHLGDVTMPHHTRGVYQPGEQDFTNVMMQRRVREDGTVTWQPKEIGNMGGLPTELNYSFIPSFSNGNQRLAGKSANKYRSGSRSPIINQYNRSENSPVDNTGNFRHTPMFFNNPNNLGTAGEFNTDTWKGSGSAFKDIAFTRALGLRFGGVDLDVEVDDDGTKLKDIVGGIQIVRAERTGADEQVKDQGIILNAWGKHIDGKRSTGHDTKERPKVWTHSSPVMSGSSVPNGNTGGEYIFSDHKYRDDGGDEVGGARPQDYIYEFHGVNGKVAGDWAKNKQGITKIRQEFIANPSNLGSPRVPIAYGNETEWRSLTNNHSARTPRHYISKLLHTYNTRLLARDGGNNPESRWIESNLLLDIDEITSNTVPGYNYGFIGDYIFGTEAWFAVGDNDSQSWNSLETFTSPGKGYNGGGTGNKIDDDRWFRGAMSPGYIIKCGIRFAQAFGQLSNTVGGNAHQHLSCFVASIVEPNSQPYGGLRNEAIQNTRFHTTGHFLTIDNTVLDDIEDNNYVLDEMEVWGGDCILDIYMFARILPTIEYNEDGIPEPNGKEANSSESGDSRIDIFNPKGEWRDWSHAVMVPLESKYNFRLTYKDSDNGIPTWAEVGTANGVGFVGDNQKTYYRRNTNQGIYTSTDDDKQRLENFQLQSALGYFDRVRSFSTKPVDFIDITDHPSRWHWSNLKQPHNQRIDIFRQFEELSNYDMDATYGQITGNAKLNDNIYSMQESAFSRLRVNERAIADTGAGEIKLGEGGVMDGAEYISYEYGTQHRDSVTNSDRAIYWIDAVMKKVMRFGGDGLTKLSDIKGLHSFVEKKLFGLSELEQIIGEGGITSSFDYGNNDVYFTILNRSRRDDFEYTTVESVTEDTKGHTNGYTTLLYNEDVQKFQTILTAYPYMYLRNGANFYGAYTDGKIHQFGVGVRGNFFGRQYYSFLNIRLNHQSRLVKKFDTSIINMNEEALAYMSKVSFSSEGNTHAYLNLADEITNVGGYATGGVNNRAKYRQGLLRFPIRERESGKPRLSGKSADMQMWYDNSGDIGVSITNIDTVIRYHSRK